MKIYNVIQKSIMDGEELLTSVPCSSFEVAKKVMETEINTLLSEGHYKGVSLEGIENSDDDNYALSYNEEYFYLSDNYDDYSEEIKIEEKELVTE